MATKHKNSDKQGASPGGASRSGTLPTQMRSGAGAYKRGSGAYSGGAEGMQGKAAIAQGSSRPKAAKTTGASGTKGGVAASGKSVRPASASKAGTSAAPAASPSAPRSSSSRSAGSSSASSSRKHSSRSSRPASRAGDSEAPSARKRRWPRVLALVLLCLVVLAVGLFSCHRWLLYDDAAQFQGTWQVSGSDSTIVIDESLIWLTDEVAYEYELDTAAKTISFSFGDMEGQGRYRFSLDRSQLVITDGEGYTWATTLFDDVGWMADQLLCTIQGVDPEQPEANESTTVLDWASSDTAAPTTDSSNEEAAEEDDSAVEGESTEEAS